MPKTSVGKPVRIIAARLSVPPYDSAMCSLGALYYDGECVEKDLGAAVYWYLLAYCLWLIMIAYTWLYTADDGCGCRYRLAARQQFAPALYLLGLCCLRGEGLAADDKQACVRQRSLISIFTSCARHRPFDA